MPKSSTASAAAAAAVLSTLLFGGDGTLASEPMRLNAGQMDAVTAGEALTVSAATAVAVGFSRSVALTDTAAVTILTGGTYRQTSGEAAATAAGDVQASSSVASTSLVAQGARAYAGVTITASAEAAGDDAYTTGRVETNAAERGRVIVASGSGWTYANGEVAQTTAATVPSAEGAIVVTQSTIRKDSTRLGTTLTTTRGLAISANP